MINDICYGQNISEMKNTTKAFEIAILNNLYENTLSQD